jgi:hypothetical protein
VHYDRKCLTLTKTGFEVVPISLPDKPSAESGAADHDSYARPCCDSMVHMTNAAEATAAKTKVG